MTSSLHSRRIFQPALAALLLSASYGDGCGPACVDAQGGSGGQRPPLTRRIQRQAAKQNGPKPNQEHLAQWMDRHSNLPLAEQQTALENEPGFRDLPPQTQQRMRDRLTQLNNMTSRAAPPHPGTHRGDGASHSTAAATGSGRAGAIPWAAGRPSPSGGSRLPRSARDAPTTAQASHELRPFRGQFSDQERNTLSDLLAVEPYLPVQRPNDGTSFGKYENSCSISAQER